MAKTSLNQFLFKSIIGIVVSVFLLYGFISFISDRYGDGLFSGLAEKYSASHIFQKNYLKERESLERIKELGGFVLVMEEDGQILFASQDLGINRLEFEDISLLVNGKYRLRQVEYFASISKIPGQNQYGLVLLPTSVVDHSTTIRLNQGEEGKAVISFLLLRLGLLIPAIVLLVFIFAKILKRKLVIPLQGLKEAFTRLKHQDYSSLLGPEKIEEFNDLNHSFKDLASTLEALNHNKEEYKRKRNQLFSDISHDLKTPITVIKGYTEAIIDKKVKPEEVDKYLALIKKNADNLQRLTGELADIVNYERSDYDLNLERIDILEYFRQAIIDFLPIFEEKEMKVISNIPNRKFYYPIDKKLFFRVLQNLMINVVNHNPSGIEVLLAMEIMADQIKIVVADTGVAISSDYSQDIFDEFTTHDFSRNPANNHNGLGLPIVKKIVELHKGQIYLDSNYTGYQKAFIICLYL